MLELRNPEVLRQRVSGGQATGAAFANKGLGRQVNLPWGTAIVNATAKSVPIISMIAPITSFCKHHLTMSPHLIYDLMLQIQST